ncbi:matrixin family metalloprotease [Paenibacillus endoradicis]|uniref:matrixin family metalloprotease n=1 Tax=Paenibacillus endoradicis TaxID=2972487 RepID=UPI002158C1CB|nr:matrixin family metalloprotease [Paenibacillus endoradicis]MCR8656560.1 matrixin family metalloprotease [Paenibacillus endoradicis]
MYRHKIGYRTILIAMILICCSFSSAAAYSYWGSIIGFYKLDGGVTSGYYHNFASNITHNGKSYNMKTSFDSAFSIWMSDTEANLIPLPTGSTATPKITAYSSSFPEKPKLYGWATMYKNGANISPLLGEGAPSSSWDKAFVFLNVDGLDDYGMNYTASRAVAFHEIGHALGLAHFSGQPSIMDDTTTNGVLKILTQGWTIPQTDDINGINNLY